MLVGCYVFLEAISSSLSGVSRTEAGPEEDFGDHCVVVAGCSRPRGVYSWREGEVLLLPGIEETAFSGFRRLVAE